MADVYDKGTIKQRVFGIITILVSIIASIVIFLGGILASPLGPLLLITILALPVPIIAIVSGARTLKAKKYFGLVAGIASLVLVVLASVFGYGQTLQKTIAVQQLNNSVAQAANNDSVQVNSTYSKSFSGVNCRVEAEIPKDTQVLSNVLEKYAQESFASNLSGCIFNVNTGLQPITRDTPRTNWSIRVDSEVSKNTELPWDQLAQWVQQNEGCSVMISNDYYDGTKISLNCDGESDSFASLYDPLPQAVTDAIDTTDISMRSLSR